MITSTSLLEAKRVSLLTQKDSATWTEDTQNLLIDGARTKNYIGSSPILSIKEMGFPMIKKNNERLYTLARARIISAADQGRLNGLNACVLNEMRDKVKAFKN